jgi:hypothetical protein
MDHFHQLGGFMPRTEPMPEAYVLLGALAARTSSVRLGALVTGVTYRNPALLAKMVTTLDIVSKGRAFLGLGASWQEDEYRAYGFGQALPPSGSGSTGSRRRCRSAGPCSRRTRPASTAATTASTVLSTGPGRCSAAARRS